MWGIWLSIIEIWSQRRKFQRLCSGVKLKYCLALQPWLLLVKWVTWTQSLSSTVILIVLLADVNEILNVGSSWLVCDLSRALTHLLPVVVVVEIFGLEWVKEVEFTHECVMKFSISITVSLVRVRAEFVGSNHVSLILILILQVRLLNFDSNCDVLEGICPPTSRI